MCEHGDFHVVAAAAVATRAASLRNTEATPHDRKASQHPMLAGAPLHQLYGQNADEDSLDFAVRLAHRLDLFRNGSASWGLVDDWRPDGSVFKRHGVIIELRIDVSDAIFDPEKRTANQRRIREAIDLVQLVIALDPSALRKTLLHDESHAYKKPLENIDDELSAVARGVSWELRLQFDLRVDSSGPFHTEFIAHFMESFDQALSDATFTQQRQELLQALVAHENPTLQRVAKVAAQSIVRAELRITTGHRLQDSVVATEDFFEHVAALLAGLHRYQSRGKPRRWRKYAPFRVEAVVLKLGTIPLTAQVLRLAKALMRARIPVHLSRLSLSFQLICCQDSELRKFLQVVTKRTRNLKVSTGGYYAPEVDVAIDADGQNRFERINTLLKAIASIPNIETINVAHLLAVCSSTVNRAAVWSGLFDYVLSREQPVKKLIFRIGLFTPQLAFTSADGHHIQQSVAWWREWNPHRKLRVRHLEIHFETTNMSAVGKLLSAFDDVEKVTFRGYGRSQLSLTSEQLRLMLRYPSIEGIYLTLVSIPTMDLFNPSVLDSSLPVKPILRELELDRLSVEDVASLPRFFDALKHTTSKSSTTLASKLESLDISMSDRHPVLDSSAFEILDNALSSNTTLRRIGISILCTDPENKYKARDVVGKHSGRHLPISKAEIISEIVKARKTAFLSVIRDGWEFGARCQLDATLVSKIFAFSAPHATRWSLEVFNRG